jgi:hypothetical protein
LVEFVKLDSPIAALTSVVPFVFQFAVKLIGVFVHFFRRIVQTVLTMRPLFEDEDNQSAMTKIGMIFDPKR